MRPERSWRTVRPCRSRTASDTLAALPRAASDPTVNSRSMDLRNGLGWALRANVSAVEADVVTLTGPFMNVVPRAVRTCTQYQ